MPRPNLISDKYSFQLPDVPTGFILPPYFSLVIPVGEDRENIIKNPSFETDTNNWTAANGASISRVTTNQYVGAYSLQIDPSSNSNGGAFYGGTTPLSLTSGNTYAVSLRFFGPTGNKSYDAYIATTAGVRLSGYKFKSNSFWQWITFIYTETATNSRRLYITSDGNISKTGVYYIDAVQVELCGSGKYYPTTYIDGDQVGLTPAEFPVPYYWTGTPHASTSVRTGITRSGGKVVNLRDLGLAIAVITGLGLAVPSTMTQKLSVLDGERYQNTQKGARVFSIGGRVQGSSAARLDQNFSAFSSVLDIDASPRQEPFVLKYQPMDEEELSAGPELSIISTYEGGLEGQRNNLNTEIFTATFKEYLPYISSHSEGATLNPGTTVANANAAIRRMSDGSWRAVSTGFTGGLNRITAIARSNDGTIWFGGDFTDAGGSGADYAAQYNPSTNTLSVIKAATTFNAEVTAIAVGPDGSIYFGGIFTNADGIAAADGIVKYVPSTNTFSALGTGVNAGGQVLALAFDTSGNLYAGGTFTSMGGVANTSRIAKWTGAAWTAMGTGATGGNINTIAVDGANVYAGGTFTGIGGVANTNLIGKWTGSAWTAMSTGITTGTVVYAVEKAPNGLIYIGGIFTLASGVTLGNIASWNGATFQPVGSPSALDNTVHDIFVNPINGQLIVGGEFSVVSGVTFPDSLASFDGSNFNQMGVDLPGTAIIFKILQDQNDGTIYICYDTNGTASVEQVTQVSNRSTAKVYPIVKIKATATSRLYSIRNTTTGRSVLFNYTLNNGETITLNFDPRVLSFTSDFAGDISQYILQGSYEAGFYLAPGSNNIAVISTGTPTIITYWQDMYLSTSDAVGKT